MDNSPSKRPLFFIDVLRCMAAIAVVTIHVLGPYRYMDVESLGWLSTITFNVASRWAVPVFIMITGALMLADTRPFRVGYYLSHRLRKAVLPFVGWSVGYAVLGGVTSDHSAQTIALGFDVHQTQMLLENSLEEPIWYHLGFFYYFLPLYLLIPFLTPCVQKITDDQLWMLVFVWAFLTLLYLLAIESPWMIDMVMYGGYLVLGYALVRTPLKQLQIRCLMAGAALALVAGVAAVWHYSEAPNMYMPGYFTSYKTFNTVVVAACCFALAYRYGANLSSRWQRLIAFISRYSLGLYLIHPLLLWPIQTLDFYPMPQLIMIPVMTLMVTAASLGLVWLLARCPLTAWLVP